MLFSALFNPQLGLPSEVNFLTEIFDTPGGMR
jgi:hypothetical protein